MKKVLSIIATVAGAAYLAAGVGLLVFQSGIKEFMGYNAGYGMELINVYPIHNVMQLALIGIPCVILGVLSMSETTGHQKGRDLLLVIYSGMALVVGELLVSKVSALNGIAVGNSMGANGLANMSVVSSVFSQIHFLCSLSLVMLLLRGAISLGENANPAK